MAISPSSISIENDWWLSKTGVSPAFVGRRRPCSHATSSTVSSETWRRTFLMSIPTPASPGGCARAVATASASAGRIRISGQLSQNQALQIVRLGDVNQDRVIAALRALLDQRDLGVRVGGGGCDHVDEQLFANVVRATARDEKAAGAEQLQRAQVDFLVARERLADRRPILREGGRIEHDGVEPLPKSIQLAQLVEDVHGAGLDVRQSVAR